MSAFIRVAKPTAACSELDGWTHSTIAAQE
jgi:hypothetical protein